MWFVLEYKQFESALAGLGKVSLFASVVPLDVLFPIRIDDACFTDTRNKRHLNRLIKQRLILDFSDPSTFDENLNKLITGMKVNQ